MDRLILRLVYFIKQI